MRRLERQLVSVIKRNLAGARPSVPEAGLLIWNLFAEIAASRTYHAAGPNPISHAEIEAYARLHRWPLEPHHIEIIRAMDDAWLEFAYGQMNSGKDGKKFDSRRYAKAQPVTAENFDAVFG